MTKVISIANHKGGVGKTTTTVNLSAGLNRNGRRILCIDLDPQANLTQSLGITDFESSVYDSLTQNSDLVPVNYREGFDVIPSHINLSGAEVELINEPGREYILKGLLKKIKDNYDFVFIDCPPSLGLLTINAFAIKKNVSSNFIFEYFTKLDSIYPLQKDQLLKSTQIIEDSIQVETLRKQKIKSLQEELNKLKE